MTTYTEEACPFKDDCPDPMHNHSKGVLKEKLERELIIELSNHYYEEYRYDRPNDSTEQLAAFARDIATNEVEELLEAARAEVLTELLKEDGLACDKCRVRMEDYLNNGGTQRGKTN